jgi:hypothetical protein
VVVFQQRAGALQLAHDLLQASNVRVELCLPRFKSRQARVFVRELFAEALNLSLLVLNLFLLALEAVVGRREFASQQLAVFPVHFDQPLLPGVDVMGLLFALSHVAQFRRARSACHALFLLACNPRISNRKMAGRRQLLQKRLQRHYVSLQQSKKHSFNVLRLNKKKQRQNGQKKENPLVDS